MDPETRDKLRASALRRAISCPRCGSTALSERPGSGPDEFAEFTYKVCGACGHVEPKIPRRRRR